MKIKSLNGPAMGIVQNLLDDPRYFGLRVTTLDDGSTIIDAGKKGRGGYEAGRLIGEICMGGMGKVGLSAMSISGIEFLATFVYTDLPLEACILSQLAGWSIKVGKFRAMGSGPARALARTEKLFEEFAFEDEHNEAVIVLETSKTPTTDVSNYISDKCGVKPSDLYMVMTPTSSLSGAVQICARIVETGMHKMHTMELDLSQVVAGFGSCPIPPLSKDDLVMMGRTNDAMLYGGTTQYAFKNAESIDPRIEEIPSDSSSDYGRPFGELFEAAGYDFYKLDPGLFSPAIVRINDIASGRILSSGELNSDVLTKSFGLS
jgi:methenyltetrahydromethanopterin cyclohydrolase